MTQRKALTTEHSHMLTDSNSPPPYPKLSPASCTLLRAEGTHKQEMKPRAHHLFCAQLRQQERHRDGSDTWKICTGVCGCGPATSSQMTGPTMKPESTAFLLQIYSIWLPHQDRRNIFQTRLLVNSLTQGTLKFQKQSTNTGC